MAPKTPSRMTRVTVTLPGDLVDEIDRLETNRSRFVVEGVRRELLWRRREALRLSLRAPHAETAEMAEEGLAAWFGSLPDEDASALVDPTAGRAVAWKPGLGWVETEE
jgi:Arc/MetJ-type ribon-helix-helix transcriptional regulator